MTYAAHEDGVSKDTISHVERRNILLPIHLKGFNHKSHNMLLSRQTTLRVGRTAINRGISTSSSRLAATKRKAQQDDIHRPSLSGSSVGHLFSEINAMRPGMEDLKVRAEGMTEEQRTHARRITTWLMGVPVVLGTLIVGGNWLLKDGEDGPESS